MTKGIKLALATAVISGFAVFLNKFAAKAFGNPYVFTTWKNLPVGLLFLGIILAPKFWKQIKKLNKKQWGLLGLIAVIGGSVPFLMFFKGLTMVSSGNAALIHKTLFIWVGVLAVVFLKEKFGKFQILALALLLGGNLLLQGFKGWSFSGGDALIFGATLLWSVEYIFAKKLLRDVSSEIVAWGRMFLGSVILVIFMALTGRMDAVLAVEWGAIKWLLVSSVLLFGYVFTWYKALKHAPASVVTVALIPASLITVLLNSIFVTGVFTLKELAVSILFAGGVVLFYWRRRTKEVKNDTSYFTSEPRSHESI